MQGTFLLDIVVRKSSSVLKLLSSEDQSLLVWGNAFLVLDLGFHVLNGVGRFNLKSDGLASQGLDEDLHTSSQSKNQMQGTFLLDVVIRKSSSVLKLLSSEDQSLLVWWNAFLVLDLSLHIQGLDKDLHASSQSENKMESTFLLDVVVREGSSILKLLSSEDQSLLVWRDSFLVLDLGLDILNRI